MQTGKPVFRPNFEFGYTYSKAEADKILEMLKKDLNTEDLSVVPFASVEFQDDFAEGGETDGADTINVKEDEIELVDAGGSGGGGGGGGTTPPPPTMPYIDIDELKDRLNVIKNYKFRLPQFAQKTFNANLTDKWYYYDDIFRLAIAQRYAISIDEGKLNEKQLKDYYEFVIGYNFYAYILFRLYDDFKLREDDNISYINLNPIAFISLNIKDVEKIIPYFQNQDFFDGIISYQDFNLDFNNLQRIDDNCTGYPPEKVFEIIFQFVIGFLDELERLIINDRNYEKILILSMVMQPKLFSEDWVQEHLDYVLKSLGVLSIPFLKNQDKLKFSTFICLKPSTIWFDNVMQLTSNNLNTINIIRKSDGYVFYFCENLRCLSIDVRDVKITRKKDLVLSEKRLISNIIHSFYLDYQKIVENKKETLENLEILFNLQQDYYRDELRKEEINYKIKSLI
jgi:hypothetical protein